MMTSAKTTWDVWVGGEKTSYTSADEALRAYTRAVSQRGEAIVSVERDGYRALSECLEAAEAEATSHETGVHYSRSVRGGAER